MNRYRVNPGGRVLASTPKSAARKVAAEKKLAPGARVSVQYRNGVWHEYEVGRGRIIRPLGRSFPHRWTDENGHPT